MKLALAPTMGRLAAALVLLSAAACGGSDDGASDDGGSPQDGSPEETTQTASTDPTPDSASPDQSPQQPARPRLVDTLVNGLTSPWGLDFLPNGNAVVTERDTSRVLVIRNGTPEPIGTIDITVPANEAGLLGVAVSPDFARNSMLYFYVSTAEDNRIVRATYEGGRLGDVEPILTGIPQAQNHDGGRLAFDEDGILYASTGDAGDSEAAQDKSSLAGKILRMTADGEPAPGNPSADSVIWSWGHRNVQGLAFDDTGQLWASEFGAQDWDELNKIEKDANYGWPRVEGDGGAPDYTDPQVVWRTDSASPSGLAFAEGHLWMASLRGERLWRVEVHNGKAGKATDWFVGDHGRMRTVKVAPDGRLWVTTSNTDGRAEPEQGDDRILVIEP